MTELNAQQLADLQVLAASSLRLRDALRLVGVAPNELDDTAKLPPVVEAFEKGRLFGVRTITTAAAAQASKGNISAAKLLLGRTDRPLSRHQEDITRARLAATATGLDGMRFPDAIASVDAAMKRARELHDKYHDELNRSNND
jgi:hypothetical protein